MEGGGRAALMRQSTPHVGGALSPTTREEGGGRRETES